MADLQIEVVYARADAQTIIRLSLPSSTTVQDAVERSGILRQLPRDASLGYGIFGRRVSGNHRLSDGDRIELYRPLEVDPRVARRRRAKPRRGARR